MGENKYLNYILIAVILLLLVLQIWNPFKKKDEPTAFDKSFARTQEALDRFEKLNNILQYKADSLKMARLQIDSAYNRQMPQYDAALAEISRKIDAANRQYLTLIKDLNAEKDRFLKSGAPDSIPMLDQLRARKYLNATPN